MRACTLPSREDRLPVSLRPARNVLSAYLDGPGFRRVKGSGSARTVLLPAENRASPGWVEVKRWNGVRTGIRIMEQPLPTGSKATLLVCDRCQKPRRPLYAWEANKWYRTLRCAPWKCRRCADLNHNSEGGALIYRTRWAAARPLSGPRLWERPEVTPDIQRQLSVKLHTVPG